MSKQHISGEVSERINPKIFNYAFYSLYRIKKEVIKFSNLINEDNYKIIDIGCGNKPYYNLFSGFSEYIGTDIIPGDNVDVICDNATLPFKDNYFDYVLCNQTLEHTKDIFGAINEIKRVLKKNGLGFISIPFLYPEHACPWDFYRFTRFGLEEIFKDFEILHIKNDTGYFTTVALFINIIFTYGKFSRILFSPLFLVVNIFFGFLEFLLLDILYNYFNFKRIKFIKYIIEGQYKQFTANYIIVIKNSKK